MAKKYPYYTSETLIDAIRRRCSIPRSDNLFEDQELLDFANDELMETVVPMIKTTNEEYFVWNELVPLENGKVKYSIPQRAIGAALRDISLMDNNGNEYEMARIVRDNRYPYNSTQSHSGPYRFYVENNYVVLLTSIDSNIDGFLKMTYLMRPNQMVLSEDVMKVSSSAVGIVLANSITAGATTTIVTSGPHHLETGEQIALTNVSGTGASLLNTTHTVTVTDSVTFTVDVDTSASGPFIGGIVDNNTTLFYATAVPETITESETIDLLKTKSPHSMINTDVQPLEVSYISNFIRIKNSDIPAEFTNGDTIARSGETDIPGIPTELHRNLLSNTCQKVLESLGDQRASEYATRNAMKSDMAASNLLEDRVTSAPLKIVNKHGVLRKKYSKFRRF